MAELIYLIFTIIAPFLGAILLRYTSQLLSIDTVSTFSISLFVLSTGVRPWRHLVHLLRKRTEALHDVVHSPGADATTSRIDQLERELASLRASIYGHPSPSSNDSSEPTTIIETATTSLDSARKELIKTSKQAELARLEFESRIESLETAVQMVLQNQHHHIDRAPPYDSNYYGSRSLTITVPSGLFHPLSWFSSGGGAGKRGYAATTTTSSQTGLQGKGLVDELRGGEKTDDEGSEKGESVRGARRSYARRTTTTTVVTEEQNGWIEWAVHTALFPLRLIRACALVLLRQVG